MVHLLPVNADCSNPPTRPPAHPPHADGSRRALTLLVPLALAAIAISTDWTAVKMAVPVAVAVIVAVPPRTLGLQRWRWWLVAALLCSAVGDWFLSTRGGEVSRFVAGIAWYLVAHVAYAGMTISRGRVSVPVLAFVGGPIFAFAVAVVTPAVDDPRLAAAVTVYAAASVFSLAAAAGISDRGRAPVTAAIVLIVCSDLLIASSEFLGSDVLSHFILPTYYFAHILFGWDALLSLPPERNE